MQHDTQFIKVQNAAHSGAFGFNPMKNPTIKMQEAGNYKKGSLRIFGLDIAIENPAGTYRDEGKSWRVADHYGYIKGVVGTDGDNLDCFVGGNLSSRCIFVINQKNRDGSFDEHKAMIGYDTPQQAILAYQLSYEQGWHGLHSIVPMSVNQFKFWLDRGNKANPVSSSELPIGGDYELPSTLSDLMWTDSEPNHAIDNLLIAMRRMNAHGEMGDLLVDPVDMDDLTQGSEQVVMLDALVSAYGKLKLKMVSLQKAMARKSELADMNAEIQISEPFKRYGSLQVSVLFTLTDGQTVAVFFHNPDTTPNKITPQDSMVSWKWMLNKKDVTIVVAPESGQDISVNEVAMRVMKLAEKNAPLFAKAQARKGERVESIKALRDEVKSLESREAELIAEIEKRKAGNGGDVSGALPKPTKTRDGSENNSLEIDSDDQYQALGMATITDIGSENIYVEKDGVHYYAKVGNTQKYFDAGLDRGDVADFSNAKFMHGRSLPVKVEQPAPVELQPQVAEQGELPEGFVLGVNGGATNNDPKYGATVYKDFGKDKWEFIKSSGTSMIRKEDGFSARTEAFEAYKKQVEALKQPAPVEPEPVVITGKELGDFPDTEEGKKALRSAVKDHLMAMRGEWVDCPAIGKKIEIRRRGIKKTISFSAGDEKLKLLAAIKGIIASGTSAVRKGNGKKDSKPDVLGYYYLKSTPLLDGREVALTVVIEEGKNGLLHYDMLIDSAETKKALLDSALSSATLPKTNLGALQMTDRILPNVLDSVNSKMVINLFIEGEEPEYVDDEEESEPKTAREFIVENAEKGKMFTVANERVTGLMDALMARGWTIYQPYADSMTMQSPTEQTLANIYSKMATDDSLFVEVDGNLDDYSDSEDSLEMLADSYTKKDASDYLENKLGAYVENGIVGDQDYEPEDDHPIEQLYYGKTVEFASSGIALEKAVKDEVGVVLWGDYEATLHNQTLFDSTTHYGITAQIGKGSRVYGRAGIDKGGMVTIYQGASGDTVFGTAQHKPDIEKLVKSLFATKKP